MSYSEQLSWKRFLVKEQLDKDEETSEEEDDFEHQDDDQDDDYEHSGEEEVAQPSRSQQQQLSVSQAVIIPPVRIHFSEHFLIQDVQGLQEFGQIQAEEATIYQSQSFPNYPAFF